MGRKILFISANPEGTDTLDGLNEEINQIESIAEQAEEAIEFTFHRHLNHRDLRSTLFTLKPSIIHISGYGLNSNSATAGNPIHIVPAKAMASLIDMHKDYLECVLFNFSHSNKQASLAVESIGCSIGMNNEIKDKSILEFSIGFYEALSQGKHYYDAYANGKNSIQTAGLPDGDLPMFKYNLPVMLKDVLRLVNKYKAIAEKEKTLSEELSKGSGHEVFIKWLDKNKNALAKEATANTLVEAKWLDQFKFSSEVEMLLELINGSLITSRNNLLDFPEYNKDYSADTYIKALEYIATDIQKHQPSADSLSQFKENLKYLIERLP